MPLIVLCLSCKKFRARSRFSLWWFIKRTQRAHERRKILLATAIASCLGVIIYWTLFDFWRAGFAAYLPFLIPPIAAASFWVSRERRLRTQVVLWKAVMAPFPTRNFPAATLDLESQGVGWMEIRGGVKVGAVACQPTDAGIHLRMAYGSPRFNPKLIPWEEIARLSYLQTGTLKGFGEASLGYVAVQFAAPRTARRRRNTAATPIATVAARQ